MSIQADASTDYLRPYTPPPPDRWCACGTRLSRYNQGDVCAVCERKAAIAAEQAQRAQREAAGQLVMREPDPLPPVQRAAATSRVVPCADCGSDTYPGNRRRGRCRACAARMYRDAGQRECGLCGVVSAIHARGLCGSCWHRARALGTLAEFPSSSLATVNPMHGEEQAA